MMVGSEEAEAREPVFAFGFRFGRRKQQRCLIRGSRIDGRKRLLATWLHPLGCVSLHGSGRNLLPNGFAGFESDVAPLLPRHAKKSVIDARGQTQESQERDHDWRTAPNGIEHRRNGFMDG